MLDEKYRNGKRSERGTNGERTSFKNRNERNALSSLAIRERFRNTRFPRLYFFHTGALFSTQHNAYLHVQDNSENVEHNTTPTPLQTRLIPAAKTSQKTTFLPFKTTTSYQLYHLNFSPHLHFRNHLATSHQAGASSKRAPIFLPTDALQTHSPTGDDILQSNIIRILITITIRSFLSLPHIEARLKLNFFSKMSENSRQHSFDWYYSHEITSNGVETTGIAVKAVANAPVCTSQGKFAMAARIRQIPSFSKHRAHHLHQLSSCLVFCRYRLP